MNRLQFSALSLLGLLFASSASAQSTNTQVILGLTNEAYATESFLGIHSVYNQERTVSYLAGPSSSVGGSYSQDFTGLDRDGNERTLAFSASGSAVSAYGRLNTYNRLEVENSFYNAENLPYFNSQTEELNTEGVPDYFDNFTRAQFTDILKYGGELQAGYQARYVFRVHGIVQGNAQAGATLTFGLPGGYERFDFNYATPGESTQLIWTDRYAVDGDMPQEVTVQFASFSTGHSQWFGDGETIYGLNDFRSTITLAGIEMTDATGRIVGGWTLDSGSGTVYPQAVPEPASMAALALGGLAFFGRRRSVRQ